MTALDEFAKGINQLIQLCAGSHDQHRKQLPVAGRMTAGKCCTTDMRIILG
jgi:hypothetical protein